MTRDAEHTPPPQSVVVPVELAETPAIRNALGLYRSAILCGEQWSDTCRDAYLAALKELDQLAMLAAAPAPSSLAGGEVLTDALDAWIVDGLKKADQRLAEIDPAGCSGITPEDVKSGRVAAYQKGFQNGVKSTLTDASFVIMKAALSPEAPAREVYDLLPDEIDLFRIMRAAGRSNMDKAKAVAAHLQTLTPRHEAPAEGVMEQLNFALGRLDYMASACEEYWSSGPQTQTAHGVVVRKADLISVLSALRARSSAPEAREGEAVGWTGSGSIDALKAGFAGHLWPRREAAHPVALFTHPAAPSADKLRFNPTHRHWARGTTYEVIGEARLQQAGQFGPVEGDSITVYRGEDGQLWCRAQSEFEDGRFETLSAPDALKGDGK